MRNAITSGDRANFSKNIQGMQRCYVAIHRPAVLVSGTCTSVNSAADVGVYELNGTFTGATSAKRGMTVGYLFNGLKRELKTRLRAQPASTILLKVQQESEGDTGGIKVYKEYRPWVYRQRYSGGAWLMDYDLTYTDTPNETFIPQAQFGGTQVFYKEGSVTFAFDGTRSRAWTPLATISSYLWTFPDSTTATGSTATWTTSTAYPDGDYVSLRVTDSNGRTHTTYRLIYKFDAANPPSAKVTAGSINGQWGDGCQADITVMTHKTANLDGAGVWDSLADIDNIPNGARVTIFADFQYGTVETNIGSNSPTPGTGASRIIFDGWVTSANQSRDGEVTTVTFQAETISGVLKSMMSPAIALDDDVAAANWLEMTNITLENSMWHIVNYRSNISEIADIDCGFFQGAAHWGNVKKYLDLAAAPFWSQMQELAGMIPGGAVSCDSQGSLYLEIDELILNGNLSSLAEPVLDNVFISDMFFSMTAKHSYIRQLSQVSLGGVAYDTPSEASYPSDPFGQGAAFQEKLSGYFITTDEATILSQNIFETINNIQSEGISEIETTGKNMLIDAVPQGAVIEIYKPEEDMMSRIAGEPTYSYYIFFVYPREFSWQLEDGYCKTNYKWKVAGVVDTELGGGS